MIVGEGFSYGKGVVRNPSGAIVLEFEEDLNPDLDSVLLDVGGLLGKEVDPAGLPDFVVIDGIRYDIVPGDDRPEVLAIATQIQTAFNLPSLAHAKAAAKLIWRISKRQVRTS